MRRWMGTLAVLIALALAGCGSTRTVTTTVGSLTSSQKSDVKHVVANAKKLGELAAMHQEAQDFGPILAEIAHVGESAARREERLASEELLAVNRRTLRLVKRRTAQAEALPINKSQGALELSFSR